MKSDQDHPIFRMSVAKVYPLYVKKVERKGRTQSEVDEVMRWLTGYSDDEIEKHLDTETNFQDFFDQAPKMHPNRELITGMICGVRVENIEQPTMKAIRQLDQLVDEIARGKKMEKILRTP